jgi:3-hydroxyacyl-CoA dehydrogenase
MTTLVGYAVQAEIAIVTLDSPPVNALGRAVRKGLLEALDRALGDSAVKAIVLTGAGKHFSAGADINEFGEAAEPPHLPDVVAAIEACSKPVIAALRGSALGGGLELALSAHGRVGAPSTRVGFPEVSLGLLPGAGGTQRLPRLVGVETALEMITSGTPVSADSAHQIGILDALTSEVTLLDDALAMARQVAADGSRLRRVSELDAMIAPARPNTEIFKTYRKTNARKFRGALAPDYGVRAVEAAIRLPFDEGLRAERALFLELRAGEQSAAMRYAFFAERQVWKIPDLTEDLPIQPLLKIGVIGAGTMGGGIAMTFANAGLAVTLVETSQAALDHGLRAIRANYERSRTTTSDIMEQRMTLLSGSLDFADLADQDLVIEAVYEDMEVKKDVFRRLNAIVRPDAILASNTSYLDIDEIAGVVVRPERFLGLHFFSPAHVMRLLQVVRGARTSSAAVGTAMQLARKLGKIGVQVGVCQGFVGNRMLAHRTREANALLVEGALPWQLDRVLTDFGMAMGPFAMRDLAGLDLGWKRETSNAGTIRDRLCELGRLGQKSGAGFYDYDGNRRATPSPLAEQVILEFSRQQGVVRRAISDEEILERCLYPMVNEGAKILEEGMALRASDIDVVWLNGYAWPRYRGGPMWWADQIGLPKILETLGRYERDGRAEFRPAALLQQLVHGGQRFQDLT